MARIILSEAAVRISIDVTRAEKEAERAGEKYGREYARGAENESRKNPAKIKLDPLSEDFQRQVKSMVDRVARDANASIPLTAGGEKLRAQIATQIAEIERTLKVGIPTEPGDALEYRRKLAAMVREVSSTVHSRISVDVDMDRNIISRTASRLGQLFSASFRSGSHDTFSGLVEAGTGVFGKLGDILSSIGSTLSSSFSKAVGPVSTVLKGIAAVQYVVPAAAAGISLLGGSAVAAFGAISAGALGLPALLTTIAAPIAAITLGMDGIKRAAAPLTDEIKLLRDVLNITFELTLRPVFERLQVIFPTLTAGLSEVARATVRVASDIAEVVTSESGIENLRVAFAGVSVAIDGSREGLKTLFTSLLNVAGTRELYVILGDTIGGVAARFGDMIERVRSSGDLAGALTQLRDVLFGVTDVLNILIEGSIKFFEAAGPGITSFFASLGEVLSRIDFAALGESFGGMLDRLGNAIANIPPEKWKELADSIGNLTESFIKMVEEGKLTDLITGIADFANALFMLKSAIDSIEDGLNGLNDTVGGAGDSIYENITKPFYNAVGDLFEYLGIGSPAQKFIDIGISIVQGILLGLAGGPAAVFGKIREIAQSTLNALGDAGTFLVDKGHQLADGIKRGIGDKAGEVRAKAVEVKDGIKGALGDAGNALYGVGQDIARGLARGISAGASWIADAARSAASQAYNAAKSLLGISSPSRLFRDLGLNTGAGLQLGIEESTQRVLSAIGQMLGGVASLLSPGIADTVAQAFGSAVAGFGAQLSIPATQPGVGAGRDTFDAQAIADAIASTQWIARFNGPNVVEVVNDGNRQLARR